MTIAMAVKKGYPLLKSDVEHGPEYEIRYSIVTDNPLIGPKQILSALPFTLGSIYVYEDESDDTVLCTEISTPERTGPLTWETSCIFSRSTPPFLRLPEIAWSHDDRAKPVRKAWRLLDDGTWTTEKEMIVNSAGGTYETPIMRDAARLVLKYTRNEQVFPIGHAQTFQDTCNDEVFLGWPQGTVLCKHIDGTYASEQYQGTWFYYWRVTYEFHFDPDGWIEELIDNGGFFRDLRTSVGGNPNPNHQKICAVRDKDGVPMHGPFLLDGQGGLLPDDDALAGRVKIRRYAYRRWYDFAPMEILIPY